MSHLSTNTANVLTNTAADAVRVNTQRAASLTALAAFYAMLVCSSLPDGMAPPVLKELFVDRYGVSASASHWFMATNLIGAAFAIPVIAVLRRKISPALLLGGAAACNAVLLCAMAFPIGYGWTMALRFVEGAADLIVLAVLFDLIVKSGSPDSRGKRLGIAGMLLMLGIGTGMVLGGRIGDVQPTLVFWIGAAACGAVAVTAFACMPVVNGLVRSCPAAVELDSAGKPRRRLLWPALAMSFSDRAVAGLMTTTLLLFFSIAVDLSAAASGGLLGASMLCMAFGAWPAGVLGDKVGHLRLRVIAALSYAAALVLTPIAAQTSGAALLGAMVLLGVSGAALMPTAMAIASRSGKGSVAMGAYHTAGNIGFFCGIVGAGVLLTIIGGAEPDAAAYSATTMVFALGHAAVTAATCAVLLLRRR